jgi:choline-glycine betaine transporter
MVLGIVIFVLALVVLAGGISVFMYNQDTDSEGYVYSNVYHVNTSTYAFTLYMNQFKLST